MRTETEHAPLARVEPVTRFNPDPNNGDHVTFVDCMTMPNVSDKVYYTFCAALVTFLGTGVLDVIEQVFYEQIPTLLTNLTIISGATVALMSIGYYLKEAK
jgi:hypothetical protein